MSSAILPVDQEHEGLLGGEGRMPYIRHHISPHRRMIFLQDVKDVPVNPELLDAARVTVMRPPDGNQQVKTDNNGLVDFAEEIP